MEEKYFDDIEIIKKSYKSMASLKSEVDSETTKPFILEKENKSTIRFALISDERLYRGFEYEGEMFYLTEENWEFVLKYEKLDFIMVESCFETVTGDWDSMLTNHDFLKTKLADMLQFAQSCGIPTVYWFTLDHEYHHLFGSVAKYFDYVFCADKKEIEYLKNLNIQSELLLPAVQEKVFNPYFNDLEEKKSNTVLFDGLIDIEKYTKHLSYLEYVSNFNLKIYESELKILKNRLKNIEFLKQDIFGMVTFEQKLILLKNAKVFIMDEVSAKNQTTQIWLALEALSCRIPVIYRGSMNNTEISNNCILEYVSYEDFLDELYLHTIDDDYSRCVGHIGWRYVMNNHTFTHRMKFIYNKINKKKNQKKYPLASIITPTMRSENIDIILENYKKQTYPNLELIIVCNGFRKEDIKIKNLEKNIKLLEVPKEWFAGGVLNHGIENANGEYCFRVDDDDIYGENYIFDMMLAMVSMDIDFAGKSPCPIKFLGEEGLYYSKIKYEYLWVDVNDVKAEKIWFGGNTFAGKREFFLDNKFNNQLFGNADTDFQVNIQDNKNYKLALLDSFNIVAMRDYDVENHTWKIGKDKIVKNRIYNKIEGWQFI